MEIIYAVVGFIAGGAIIWFARQSAVQSLMNTHLSEISRAEKDWLTRNGEAERAKSLAQQRAETALAELEQRNGQLQREREKAESLNRNLAASQADLTHLRERLENQTKELEQIQKRFHPWFLFYRLLPIKY